MHTTEETAKKMREVLALIEANLPTTEKPKVEVGLDMDAFGATAEDADIENECRTALCFAGWNCIANGVVVSHEVNGGGIPVTYFKLDGEPVVPSDFSNEKFGITFEDEEKLYYTEEWPTKFVDQYKAAKDMRGRFEVLRARVEYFIETGE